ncbi:acetoacetate decarboxylase [Prauserella sediminis]|uniref:Acetoacetate decarboxylase n=1 Tax=Prauserella sediminis TaxID=577680 RepID=A0A839XXL5_9PSEU|nr:acetoacetate decarboxylase family protein [Prauserella sediminis]MBB3664515.1 acetoacetate decarboxylase [Prauserella sediminis]
MSTSRSGESTGSPTHPPLLPERKPPGAMPAFAPLYMPGTEEVALRWMSVTYPVSQNVAAAVLPRPLSAPRDPEVIIWIAEFLGARFTDDRGNVEARPAYMQGGVNLECLHGDLRGAYALETFVEGLNHGILGREMFGLPKKQVTEARLKARPGGVEFGITDALGHELLRGSARDAVEGNCPAPPWFETQFTAKLIPRADGPGYDFARLVQIPFQLSPAGPFREGEAELEWRPSSRDPLHLLAPTGPAHAVWGPAELAIDYGTYVAELDPNTLPVYGTPGW